MDPLAKLSSLLRKSQVGDHVILELDLDFSVLSSAPANPFEAFKLINAPTMRALRDGLRTAAADAAVAGLIVHIGTCPLTASQCCELADLIAGFGERQAGLGLHRVVRRVRHRPVAVRVGSACRSGVAAALRRGRAGRRPGHIALLRGTLDKVGVEPQFGQRKEYKTAADTYAAHEISPANHEMIQQITNSITHWAVDVIPQRRGRSAEQVWTALDAGILDPEQAQEHGLIDRIGYRDEVYAAPAAPGGSGRRAEVRPSLPQGVGGQDLVQARLKPAVAVVEVRGAIVAGRPQRQNSQPMAASETVCQHLRAAADDDQVKAVVLRVESPGGSYIASDAIRREVLRLREAGRPVVAMHGRRGGLRRLLRVDAGRRDRRPADDDHRLDRGAGRQTSPPR